MFTGQGVHAEPTIRTSVQLSLNHCQWAVAVCVCACVRACVRARVYCGSGCAHT
jgi:hypothetical protein